MDWDDIVPKTARGLQVVVGDNLETLSVAELEQRILVFETEIARVRDELEKKRRHEAAASALFKS
ncbi:DUF1192 domain-containing protein [Hyphomicrobium sulfonivorans]|uniref:DUF1192 domain-containing protein n=1 Tax=Hyphomicrobium sulfonivorans TaxID=121290 RepID=A0A109BKJ5_HYPSL|nr:DUF1192 domain-containing protein [Hyphomicrobium sulfonivorans]KWT70366.1 hypothetical protein APY04_1043 [Hyphomicrobium sulfonivorans]MBI1649715.1 DUF1192 domain-containing protein [Hyphomicrobium sulfonivorans]NSL71630.1 DUF1192 domain-containing protein [Hyphomicrobium sulfonivorans]